ncbi:YybH family protein [Aestuariivivens insulae]|uniref:YybH family protein n=1 Tax=Aestuariivivens insulae TaxID=1621988 RepID=UPI001F575BF8|nr:nuclear transport factor 2 family protein [Aestuariivivens insulae]
MKNFSTHKIGLLVMLLFMSAQILTAQTENAVDIKYPKAQKEVKGTMDAILESVKEGEIDKLIAFHAYGPKFTEFKMGESRVGSKENEVHERNVFGSVTEVIKLDANDLKIAVYYGNVANVTFHSDFHLKFGDNQVVVNDQITLLFVKNEKGEWKIVHEHHSPLQLKG